MHLFIVFVLYI